MRALYNYKTIKVCSENESIFIISEKKNREMLWNSLSHRTHWQNFGELCEITQNRYKSIHD